MGPNGCLLIAALVEGHRPAKSNRVKQPLPLLGRRRW
jgi:hypothetical protein